MDNMEGLSSAVPSASTPAVIDYSTTSTFDPDVTMDEAVIRIFNYHFDDDPQVGDYIKAAVEKLWALQKLKADPDAAFASLSVEALVDHISALASAEDYGEVLHEREIQAIHCETRMRYLNFHSKKLARRVGAAITRALKAQGYPAERFSSMDSLVEYLYVCVSDSITSMFAARNEQSRHVFNPSIHLQVEIVVSLRYCGGLPKEVLTHNFALNSSWAIVSGFLSSSTMSVAAQLSIPEGLGLSNGPWICCVVDGAEEISRFELRDEASYAHMRHSVWPGLSGGQKIYIIHVSPFLLFPKTTQLFPHPICSWSLSLSKFAYLLTSCAVPP